MQNIHTIFIVEDEADILELVSYNLAKHNYHVVPFISGENAFNSIEKYHPDLIILDLMLPGINGLLICQLLKHEYRTSKIPIIIMTAKSSQEDILKGIESGAAAYITKPFKMQRLIEQVAAILHAA